MEERVHSYSLRILRAKFNPSNFTKITALEFRNLFTFTKNFSAVLMQVLYESKDFIASFGFNDPGLLIA